MSTNKLEIVQKADALLRKYHTRDPFKLADELDITILYQDMEKQKGMYFQLMKNRFVTLNSNLDEVMQAIVLAHEIGHDRIHGTDLKNGQYTFQEFNLFDLQTNRAEYEANLFASQILLDDEEILDYFNQGFDIQQVARAMYSDINLVVFKIEALIAQGYRLRQFERKNDFLK